MIPTERQIADEMKRYGFDRMPSIRRIQYRYMMAGRGLEVGEESRNWLAASGAQAK